MPSHNGLSVMQFLASKNIPVLAYPLVRLILPPVTSSFLQKSNSCFKQPIFMLGEEVRAKMTSPEQSYRK